MRIGEIRLQLMSGDESETGRAARRLKNLLQSVEDMYPMNRNIGIRNDVLDMPPQIVVPLLSADIYKKAEEFLPEITVTDISCAYDMERDAVDILVQYEPDEDEEMEDGMDYEAGEDEDYECD